MKIEVRSNIQGDIAKIRKGVVFKNDETVIDELFQNSQRANASQINVEISDGYMIITDDGVGCEDPQAVFEKNTTAWGNEDEAFGEGFFSVFLLADILRVRSHDWELEVDVVEMMKTGDMTIDVERGREFFDGFEVEILSDKISDSQFRLKQEVKKLGKIIPANVVIDESEVKKEAMLEINRRFTDTDVVYKNKNDLFETVLTPTRFGDLELYYEHRPVRTKFMPYVEGKVHFHKGAVTLKAPDRKDIVFDDKWEDAEERIKEEIGEMYRKFITTASDEQIDNLADGIARYLEVDDYISKLTIDESIFDFVKHLSSDEEVSEEDKQTVAEAAKEFRELTGNDKRSDQSDNEVETEFESSKNKPRRSGPSVKELEKREKLVWVRGGEVDRLKSEIRNAEYYGFQVVVARNQLYENAFEHIGIVHVSDMEDAVDQEVVVENYGPKSQKEERLLDLLSRVEEHFELEPGIIKIADLKLYITHKMSGNVETNEVLGQCNTEENRIELSRDLVDWPSIQPQKPGHENITKNDYRLLMPVLKTLSHELAHYLFRTDDNTSEHYQRETEIYTELNKIFC